MRGLFIWDLWSHIKHVEQWLLWTRYLVTIWFLWIWCRPITGRKCKGQLPIRLKDEPPRSVDASYAAGEEWRNISRKNEEAQPKWKQCPAVDVTGDGNKVRCCKEQCCKGTWNVRSMNQGNLEVVKQEMARVNIDILGISELKWTGMGKFNSSDDSIYYCRQ